MNSHHFGPTRNPHDHTKIPGGSSGGSAAAVVAGSCAGAFGTDTCGSVRIPAALSGCVGFKPTYGRISLHRVTPLSWSLDHAGPLTRTVRDAALLFHAVAGFDSADARTLPLAVPESLNELESGGKGVRVGRLRGWFEDVLEPDVRATVEIAVDALSDAGCTFTDVAPRSHTSPVDQMLAIVAGEAIPWHWATFGRDATGYGPTVGPLIAAEPPRPNNLALAREQVALEVAALLEALQRVDVLVSATVPATAPAIDARAVTVGGRPMDVEHMLICLTSVFNAARLPAISIPLGKSDAGLPIGIQVIGRHLDESTVLRVGRTMERALESKR